MNRIQRHIRLENIVSALFILLCALFFLVQIVGCTTTGRVQMTADASVDAAMKAWAQYVVAGGATEAQEAQVRQAHAIYVAASEAAEKALLTWSKTKDRTPLDQAYTVLLDSQRNLLNLIRELKP